MKQDRIPVVVGTGVASTELAAFDAALIAAGAANYNIVRLSSVIPPRVGVDASGATPLPVGAWGDRLYAVYAEERTSVLGAEAWAAVGWVERLDGEGGLFVEHEGHSEESVLALVHASLADLVAGRPEEFGPPEHVSVGVTCEGSPVAALVIAAYETAPWSTR